MESYESIERKEVDVAFVKLERVLPNIIVKPFYVDEMVLVRLRTEERTPTDVISPLDLDCRNQLYFNWGPTYQMWHERWWDTYSPPCLQLDAAALIFSLMWNLQQWAIVPRSIANALAQKDRFVVQQLSDSPLPRVCYQLTPKHSDSVKASALDTLNRFVQLIYPNKSNP